MADQPPIGFWLKLVDRLIEDRFAQAIEEHGVTRRQWQLLNVLMRGPATAEELDTAVAPFLEEGETTSIEHLTELIDSGWVDAAPEGYGLTPRGETAFGALREVVDGLRELAASGIQQEEYETTVATLEQMARNLGWTGPQNP